MKLYLLYTISCIALFTAAQDLSTLGNEKPVKISGGISANQILYSSNRDDKLRKPYTYFLSGNLSTSLYGWSIPLSFSYTNQDFSYQQPFNQYGLSPTYKWVKTYLGYNSINFSSYTLNGLRFLGAGLELKPERFHTTIMYGRFQKAVQADSLSSVSTSFERRGWGIKTGVGNNKDYVDIILFGAADDPNSLHKVSSYAQVNSQENFVVGINAGKTIGKRLAITLEQANSAYTRDMQTEVSNTSRGVYRITNMFMESRNSTSFYNAVKSGLTYSGEGFSIGLNYEKVDPDYQTMGAYYFNNDLENATISIGKRLLKGKMNIASNIGGQRNNINKEKASTMKRLVSTVNISYAPGMKLNMSGSYSNFSSYTFIRSNFDNINQTTAYDNLDTLNFTQLTQNSSFSASYQLGDVNDKKKRQNISFMLSYQVAADNQTLYTKHAGSHFYNTNCAYSYNKVPSDITITCAFNSSLSTMLENNSLTIGPTFALSKSFLDKTLRSTLSSSYNESYNNEEKLSRIVNLRASGSYSIKKKHNLNLSLVALNRSTYKSNTSKLIEFTGTLGYNYNF